MLLSTILLTIIIFGIVSNFDIRNDAAIKTAINEQSHQWTEMLNRHKKEEWDILKQQVEENKETMKKLMESVQANQMKQLDEKQERYANSSHSTSLNNIISFSRDVKELNATQAKISVETAKEVANDKTFKTKNARDKRLREKKQNNIKRFMEEKKVKFSNSKPLKTLKRSGHTSQLRLRKGGMRKCHICQVREVRNHKFNLVSSLKMLLKQVSG